MSQEHTLDTAGLVRDAIAEHRVLVDAVAGALVPGIVALAERLVEAFDGGGKVLVLGNGGSAAEAQHLAAELVGRFLEDRRALPAIALTTDTSILTAIVNDLGQDEMFARQVEALARPGDVVMLISTSGNSSNVLEAARRARRRGAFTVALTGETGGALLGLADLTLRVPSRDTARIQEMHLLIDHLLCLLVERRLASPGPAGRQASATQDTVTENPAP